MKILKWFLALFVIGLIGNMGKMYFTRSQSAIDKNMQKAMAELIPKLPATDDMGLTLTRVSYNSPTLRRYLTVPKGIDPDQQYKQKLTDAVCKDDALWMFKKGLRIENIFHQESAHYSTTLDLGMPDTTIVIDDKQCQHRGETTVNIAKAESAPWNTSTGMVPVTAPVYDAPAVVAAPAADTSADTAAAAY